VGDDGPGCRPGLVGVCVPSQRNSLRAGRGRRQGGARGAAWPSARASRRARWQPHARSVRLRRCSVVGSPRA
jgi:hypothetical protein